MRNSLFEPFREWVDLTRRRKGSKKLPGWLQLESARTIEPLAGDSMGLCVRSSADTEPAIAEFIQERRSRTTSWLNLKQLQEPHRDLCEFISTSRS